MVHNFGAGHAYVSIAADAIESGDEKILAEIEVTERSRLAVSAFFVNQKGDWNRIKITKLKFQKTQGWSADGEVVLNHFGIRNLRDFLSVLVSLNMTDAGKAKIDLGDIQLEQLSTLLSSDKAPELIQQLSRSPDLERDIYAIAAKRKALSEFESLMENEHTEPEWQKFFEENPWVFGYGLAFIFMDRVAGKLETATTGSTFDRSGKRVDGLLRTRAAVSQYVLVEIKKPDTPLLRTNEYRPGVWTASGDLSDAVSQIQKTAFEFSHGRLRDELKDEQGVYSGDFVFSVQPRTYLVIGNQAEVLGHSDKITCFELYRRNFRSPEIITFDELFERAKCIVQQLDEQSEQKI